MIALSSAFPNWVTFWGKLLGFIIGMIFVVIEGLGLELLGIFEPDVGRVGAGAENVSIPRMSAVGTHGRERGMIHAFPA